MTKEQSLQDFINGQMCSAWSAEDECTQCYFKMNYTFTLLLTPEEKTTCYLIRFLNNPKVRENIKKYDNYIKNILFNKYKLNKIKKILK